MLQTLTYYIVNERIGRWHLVFYSKLLNKIILHYSLMAEVHCRPNVGPIPAQVYMGNNHYLKTILVRHSNDVQIIFFSAVDIRDCYIAHLSQ